jgi:two-component system LytT family response regulator
MKLNCVVIDDSSIQRLTIKKLISNHPQLCSIGEFSNAIEAKGFLNSNTVDLIFLDVEMPVINGFDFLDVLKIKPQIIFITSKAEYAVKAFDYDATDYLQKPLELNRFNSAIKRAIDLHLLRTELSEEEGEHIFIKSNLKNLKILTSKIKWIEALGDYVKVISEDGNNLVLSTMKSFAESLPANKFVRIHKSYIVNIDKISGYNSRFVEIGVTKIPLSRNKKDDLANALADI